MYTYTNSVDGIDEANFSLWNKLIFLIIYTSWKFSKVIILCLLMIAKFWWVCQTINELHPNLVVNKYCFDFLQKLDNTMMIARRWKEGIGKIISIYKSGRRIWWRKLGRDCENNSHESKNSPHRKKFFCILKKFIDYWHKWIIDEKFLKLKQLNNLVIWNYYKNLPGSKYL